MEAAVRIGWRTRLGNDPTPAAYAARQAYISMLIAAPSYYNDDETETGAAYGLAREQAAAGLRAWHRAAGALAIEPQDGGTWWRIDAPDCYVSLERRPPYCDRGRFIAKLFVTNPRLLHVDAHDGWPRYYFGWDCMVEEVEAWLRARHQLVGDLLDEAAA